MQGEEICVALQTHINDVMLRRYSKARSSANGSVNGDVPNNLKTSNPDINERRVQDLSKALEESQKKINDVSDICCCRRNFYAFCIVNMKCSSIRYMLLAM